MNDHLSLNEFQDAPTEDLHESEDAAAVGEVYFLRVNSVNEVSNGETVIASTADEYIDENQIQGRHCNML